MFKSELRTKVTHTFLKLKLKWAGFFYILVHLSLSSWAESVLWEISWSPPGTCTDLKITRSQVISIHEIQKISAEFIWMYCADLRQLGSGLRWPKLLAACPPGKWRYLRMCPFLALKLRGWRYLTVSFAQSSILQDVNDRFVCWHWSDYSPSPFILFPVLVLQSTFITARVGSSKSVWSL